MKLRLPIRIGGLGPQEIRVLARVGADPSEPTIPFPSVTREDEQDWNINSDQQDTGQGQETAHGMALDKTAARPPLLCRRLSCGFGALFCRLLRPLFILLSEVVFFPGAGRHVLPKLRVLQSGGVEMIIRRRLDIPGLGLADGPRRMGADALSQTGSHAAG